MDILQPGDRVSINIFQSGVPSRHLNNRGKEHVSAKNTGGAIFYMTVHSKHKFERFCEEFGVKPKKHLTNNTLFAAATHHNLSCMLLRCIGSNCT